MLHWHQVYRLAGQLDPHLQRLWPARAHHRRLWGGVRRILQAEARRQAVHGGRRRHAAARLPLRDRRRRGVPARGRNRLQPARSGISAPAIRRASTGSSNCSAARSSIFRSGRASPIAPGRTSARSQRDLGWKPVVPFEEGVRRMMEDIELWRDAPLWDPQSIAVATKTWFEYLGTGGLSVVELLGSHYKHKIKTPEEIAALVGDAAAQAQGDHVPRRVRRRASGPFAASALRQEQGRHSRRQPDRRPAHLEGALSAARAAGSARDQSRRVRNRRLRHHRSRADAAEEHRADQAGLSSPRATNTRRAACR